MSSVAGSRVLVVGGAGFVGANLVKALLAKSARHVVAVDNLLSAEQANLPKSSKVTFIKGSITSDKVLESLKDNFDYMFQLATYHGNQNSMADPLADHANNTLTTLKFCERVKSFKKIRKVVYSSAGCTVAEKTYNDAQATTEESPVSLWMDTPYQMSKIIGELHFNYYFKRFALPVVKARFQNVYGPGEILGAGKWRGTPATVWRNVVPTFVYRALKQMDLPVENGGIATRDFIYVEDIVAGLIACAERGTAGEVYNVASGMETSILDLANSINRLTENPTPIDYKPPRDWDRSGKRYGSTEKARLQLGFEATVQLEEGLKRTVEWTRANLPLIDKCINKHRKHMA
ncbi:MAG: NAD-dependent epimerase/dehydratase family protein [Planctomycetaceae bacterium]|nr:NAD-dependent epimerase/dehydratase family protein [Planctomycetaceae bacterium]